MKLQLKLTNTIETDKQPSMLGIQKVVTHNWAKRVKATILPWVL
jgi:hypothetical protein